MRILAVRQYGKGEDFHLRLVWLVIPIPGSRHPGEFLLIFKAVLFQFTQNSREIPG
jgi:hypothetical protein